MPPPYSFHMCKNHRKAKNEIGDIIVIRATLLTALVFCSTAITGPSLMIEKTLASVPQSDKEITLKQDGSMEIAVATNAQQVETAHNSCQDVAQEQGFHSIRLLHTNTTNDPTKGAVVEVFMDMARRSRSYRANCIYNPTNGQAYIGAAQLTVRR